MAKITNNYGPKNDKFEDPMDGEYIGNIWGWKFSLMGLALILGLLALMSYRHYTMGVAPLERSPDPTEMVKDSLGK